MTKPKIFLSFLLCMMFLFMSFMATNSAFAFESSAKACCCMEASTGRILFSKNADAKLPMASTTKIMTAITAIENCADLDEEFEVSKKAIGVSGTSLYLREGDVYSTRELLYALMLISGNDASVAIAEHVGGTTVEFVTLMNETAKKIGATNSHFANTHGLDQDGHYTTASDLAKITAYALSNPTFKEIVTTKNTKITNGKNDENRYLKNKNKLLFTLEGCVGVKTGFTDDAGRCLVSAIEKDGMTVVCVVLNCGPMFEESKAMLLEAIDNFSLVEVTDYYDFDPEIPVENGRTQSTQVGTNGQFVFPLSQDEVGRLKFVYTLPETLNAPLKKGEEVGMVETFLDNRLIFSEKIVTMEDVKPKSVWQHFGDFVSNW